jgi:hypothetical protein
MYIPDPVVVQQPGGNVVWVKEKGPQHVVTEYWIFCWLGPNAFSNQKELFDRVQACSRALGSLAIVCRNYASKRDGVQTFHEEYLTGPVTIPFEKWNAHHQLLEEVVVDIESFYWFANRLLTQVALTLNYFFKKVLKAKIPNGKHIDRRRRHYPRRYSPRCFPSPGRHPRSGHTASHLGSPAVLRFSLEPGAGLRRRNMLPTVKSLQTATQLLVEPGKLDRARLVVLFKQPERFPDHFACGVVAARIYFCVHELLKLGGKRDVRG